jgi:hypothetical protein
VVDVEYVEINIFTPFVEPEGALTISFMSMADHSRAKSLAATFQPRRSITYLPRLKFTASEITEIGNIRSWW